MSPDEFLGIEKGDRVVVRKQLNKSLGGLSFAGKAAWFILSLKKGWWVEVEFEFKEKGIGEIIRYRFVKDAQGSDVEGSWQECDGGSEEYDADG